MDALLAELIDEAVKRYGPRYKGSWAIAPVLIEGDDYPETIVDDDARVIRVRITNKVLTWPPEARYQLAHEAIHCIVATGRRETIYFEEGLANHHALTLPGLPRKYRRGAEKRLIEVLRPPLAAFRALNPTDERIRALRAEQQNVDELQPALVARIFEVSPDKATAVCRRMPEGRPRKM